jgi:hypothetical protein
MRQYKALCQFKDEAGSGYGWVYVYASNTYEASQIFKNLYGRLLISESAIPC